MSRARVTSIESIDNLYAAQARLGKEAEDALAAATVIIRRTFDSIHESLKRWMREVDRRHEEVQRCKADLSFRKSAVLDNQGTTEQEIALKRAQQRLREAEEKVQTCRRWLVMIPEALKDFEAPVRQLSGWLEGEYRRGMELLKKHSNVLKEYASLEVPTTEPSTAAAPPAAPAAEPAPPPETGGSA
jgi:hypothetical protein